jgi:hypothetical protein
MASSIISSTIDETFPVAGQDNDSQGFRDNFNIIKDNFTYAKNEIEDLQETRARVDVNNTFNKNTQSSMHLLLSTLETYTNIGANGATPITVTTGHYFPIVLENDATISISGWPTTKDGEDYRYCEIFIQVKSNDSTYTAGFSGTYASAANSTLVTDTDSPKYTNLQHNHTVSYDKYTIVKAGSFVISSEYTIINPGDTDFTTIGADDSNPGTVFTATGAGSGTGIAATYISTSATVSNELQSYTPWTFPANVPTLTGPSTTDDAHMLRAWTINEGETVYLEYLGYYKA